MLNLNFSRKVVFRVLFFLACLSFVLWQCYLRVDKFLERPRSTSVGFDHAKNWPMPKFVICPTIKEDVLKQCGFQPDDPDVNPLFQEFSDEYNQKGQWVGMGPENCTNPKLLRDAITKKPDEFLSEVSINTFEGKSISYSANASSLENNSLDSLWKPVDFVYDPVSFNRYDPIVSVCYELDLPKSLDTQGIQFIDIKMIQSMMEGYQRTFMKVSPPGYLHQNSDVRSRVMQFGEDAYLELEYQIDNVLKIGDEDCHPDPSFDRDECVIKQLLNESIKLYGCIPPSLGNYGLTTCKDGSKYSMREVSNLIDCPKSCAKYTMRVRSEYIWNFEVAIENPSIKILFNELITVSHEDYSYIWLNLVAEVGGYVGLFLGLSMFQMIDLRDMMLLQRNWIESFKSLLDRLKTVKTRRVKTRY